MLTAIISKSSHLAGLKRRWGFDANEIQFMKFARMICGQSSRDSEKNVCNILVQMPNDYYYLCLFFVAIRNIGGPDGKLSGLWHQNIMSAPRWEHFQWVRRLLRRVFNGLDKAKWKKLYSVIGLQSFYTLEVGFWQALKNWRVGNRIWCSLKSKADVLALSLNGTPCGDLVYDTYLRYRVQASVDVADPYLRTVIVQALNAQCAMRRHLKNGAFNIYLSSYSSYVQHGIPVREALLAGVEVYSAGNLSQFFKRLGPDDSLHAAAHWRYGAQFASIASPEAAKNIAREQLENRFKGMTDRATLYMKSSAYASVGGEMPSGVEGVVFLHDFFDSPHFFRHMLFPDFLEWTRFTLQVVESEKLPIAFKPHPNQLPESAEVVKALQREFPSVKWLDPKISNHTIFQSGIHCGISVYGTILHELAYQGVVALAAGDHPHVDFDIAVTPKSVQEYRDYLVNFRTLSVPANAQEEVLAFYFMHNVYDKEDLKLGLENTALRSLEQSDSIALARFMNMAEMFQFPAPDGASA